MRTFFAFLIGLLLLGATNAPAQAPAELAVTAAPVAPAAHSDLSTARYDRADTLRAVQHLFMRRSKAMRGWLEGGTALLATGVVKKTVVATKSKAERRRHQSYYDDLNEDGNGDLLAGTLMMSYGAFRYARFGPQQYQRVVGAYQEGRPLPPYLTRKLKSKYFRLLPLGTRQERAEAVREQ